MTNRPEGNTPTDSIAPIELDRLTIEEEIASMNRGRGKSITGIVAAVAAAVVAVVLMLRTMDADRAYTETGAAVRGLAAEHFDSYWLCAVPAALRMPVDSGEKLATQLERVADHLGRSYGATLQRCEARLEPLPGKLGALAVPDALETDRARLVGASETLLSRVKALRERLGAVESYSFASVASEIDGVAKAYDGFSTARSELLGAVDAR
jgi:hypothetical protein